MNTPQETGGRKAVASQGGGWLRQAARLCMGRAMHPVAVADLRHEAPALPASRGATPLRGANPADASRSGALMTAPIIGRRPAVGGHYSRAQSQSVVLRVSPAAILPPVRSTGMRSASFNSGCARHRTKRSTGLRFVIQCAVPLQRGALTCAPTHGLRGAFFIGGVAAWVCAHAAILFFGAGVVCPWVSVFHGQLRTEFSGV